MMTGPEGAAAAGDYPHPVRAAVLRVVGELNARDDVDGTAEKLEAEGYAAYTKSAV